jgi:hypothetical protein
MWDKDAIIRVSDMRFKLNVKKNSPSPTTPSPTRETPLSDGLIWSPFIEHLVDRQTEESWMRDNGFR